MCDYNFFRWITADAGFAMGPSRIDPRTGQILDADIIFDAGFLNYWKQDYETFTEEDAHRLHPELDSGGDRSKGRGSLLSLRPSGSTVLSAVTDKASQQQMGFSAAAVLMASEVRSAADGKLPKKFIHQGLKEVVMHEVGHTLGLRHNFKASTWKSLEADQQALDIDSRRSDCGQRDGLRSGQHRSER